tara:strand:- start:181 stop:618 length:438 start_codon:yes stop_codon:yes gene_type:complete
MIYWFYGQPGAGKTTIAKLLKEHFEYKTIGNPVIHIDGDFMRGVFSNTDYSEEGRKNNMRKVTTIARFLHHKNFHVVISVVGPYKDVRDELLDLNPKMFYLFTQEVRGREHYHTDAMEIGTDDIWLCTNDKLPIQTLNEVLTIHR